MGTSDEGGGAAGPSNLPQKPSMQDLEELSRLLRRGGRRADTLLTAFLAEKKVDGAADLLMDDFRELVRQMAGR
jgi:hypothetical protein